MAYYGNDASNTQVGGFSAYYMGDGDDAAAGGAANESLYGGGGNDLLLGGAPTVITGAGTPADPYTYVPTAGSGADYIDGGPGTDLIQGFDGNDVLYGGDGDDSGAFNLDASGLFYKGGLYGEDGDDFLDGGRGNDRLDGGAGIDAVFGGDGDDALDGGAGADAMKGGSGNDTYIVDDAADQARELLGDGVDTVNAGVTFALSVGSEIEVLNTTNAAGATAINLTGNDLVQTITGNAGSNILSGLAGNDALSGLDGSDQLFGGLGNDALDGGAGNDRLFGGPGIDFLTGGLGNDAFVFNSAPNKFTNVDSLVDFNRPTDTIQLDNAFLTKVGSNGALKAAAFYLGKTAHDASDRIIYDKATGNLFYDADGQGGTAQIRIGVLLNKATVGLNDFVVI